MPANKLTSAPETISSPDDSTKPQWMPSAQRILRDVMALPREAREAIAIQLETSLDEFGSEAPRLTDAEFHEAWSDELNQRWEEYESGRASAIPYEQVMAHLQSRYPS